MSHSVKENMDGDRMIQFEAHCMEAHTLEQPMANNECGFYVMWAMHQYLGGNMTEGNQMVCMLHISCISVNSTKHTTILSNTCAFRYHLASTTAQ
jgi:hypothetical protein